MYGHQLFFSIFLLFRNCEVCAAGYMEIIFRSNASNVPILPSSNEPQIDEIDVNNTNDIVNPTVSIAPAIKMYGPAKARRNKQDTDVKCIENASQGRSSLLEQDLGNDEIEANKLS